MKTIILTACLIMVSSCATIKSLDEQYIVQGMYMNNTYSIEYSMNGYGSRGEAIGKAIEKAYTVCPRYKVTDIFTRVEINESSKVNAGFISRYIARVTIDCN